MQSPYLCIYDSINDDLDCSTSDYRFTSIYFNNQDDCEKVWQIGYELISLFNGTYLLLDSEFCKIEICELLNDGVGQRNCKNELLPVFLEKPDEPVADEFPKDNINIRLRLLNKAIEDKGVYLILRYFDMEPNWNTYYKILETVENLSREENVTTPIDQVSKNKI